MAKTYTTVPDKATGDVFTEAMWDTYIKDNVNNLISVPLAKVRRATNQSIPDAPLTAVQHDIEDLDTDGMHDNVTNNSRLTAATSGIYLVSCFCLYAHATLVEAYSYLTKNGTSEAQVGWPAGWGGFLRPHMAVLMDLAVADYAQLHLYQDNTANTAQNVNPSTLWAVWLSKNA